MITWKEIWDRSEDKDDIIEAVTDTARDYIEELDRNDYTHLVDYHSTFPEIAFMITQIGISENDLFEAIPGLEETYEEVQRITEAFDRTGHQCGFSQGVMGVYDGLTRPAMNGVLNTHPASIDEGLLMFSAPRSNNIEQLVMSKGLTKDDLKLFGSNGSDIVYKFDTSNEQELNKAVEMFTKVFG